MKDAAIIFTSILVGIGLLWCIIAALPVIIALAFIALIYWMIAKFLVGGFSPWRHD